MKQISKYLLPTVVASLGLVSVSFTAIASPNHDQKPGTSNNNAETKMGHVANHGMKGNHMMQMMQRMHGTKSAHMGNNMGHTMTDSHMGNKMMGHNMMGHNMQAFDTDDDGSVTPEELRNGLLAKLKKYDADGDGTLSIAEFEVLHSARIRNKMVDRFQALDEDGDGKVTEAEMTARADKMKKRMQNHQSKKQMKQMKNMQNMKQMQETAPENN